MGTKRVVKKVKESVGNGLSPMQETEVVGLINSACARFIQHDLKNRIVNNSGPESTVIPDDVYMKVEQQQPSTFTINADTVHSRIDNILDVIAKLKEKLRPVLRDLPPDDKNTGVVTPTNGDSDISRFFDCTISRINGIAELLEGIEERLTI